MDSGNCLLSPVLFYICYSQQVRPIFICQLCGDFYGDEQLKFFHHLKEHYEPHSTIIIENPVSDLGIDKVLACTTYIINTFGLSA